MNLILNLISIASYVLYALGLYTIARRRGIRNAWLAWVPVASVWILGSIADDYCSRHTGSRHNMRSWLLALKITQGVMVVILLVACVVMLTSVFTTNELTDLFVYSMGVEGDLYAVSPEEMEAQLAENLDARMTEEMAMSVMFQSLGVLAASFLTLGVTIAASVLEYICLYRLFASCDPQHAVLYFVIGLVSSLVLNVTSVFVYLCREKDLGMTPPPPPVMGYIPPPPQQPWSQN